MKMTITNRERSEGKAGSKKFRLGQVLVTPGAIAALTREDVVRALNRHVRGDWGNVGEEEWRANDSALANSSLLLSSYRAEDGTRFWVITEEHRTFTVVILPEDYIFTPVPTSDLCPELMQIGERELMQIGKGEMMQIGRRALKSRGD